MAASGEETLEGQLGQEATCPLCLGFFEQPMVLSCGHNFCRHCLAQLGPEASCLQCSATVEPGSACPNRALANVIHLVKRRRLSEGAQEESSGQWLCQEHKKPLQSFCSSKKSLLCPGCLEGHQGHPLLSLPEAAQQYKDLLDDLKSLRKEEQKVLHQRQAEEESRQQCQELLAGHPGHCRQFCACAGWGPVPEAPKPQCCPSLKAADDCQPALAPSLPLMQSPQPDLPQPPRLSRVPPQPPHYCPTLLPVAAAAGQPQH